MFSTSRQEFADILQEVHESRELSPIGSLAGYDAMAQGGRKHLDGTKKLGWVSDPTDVESL